jgi:hypothetical protein
LSLCFGRRSANWSQRKSERTGFAGVEIVDAGAQKDSALRDIDLSVDRKAALQHAGIVVRLYCKFALADDEIQRFAFLVISNEGHFDVAVTGPVRRGIEPKIARWYREINAVADDRAFEIGVAPDARSIWHVAEDLTVAPAV